MRKAICGAIGVAAAITGFAACGLDEGSPSVSVADSGPDTTFVDVVSGDSGDSGDAGPLTDADAAPPDTGVDAAPIGPPGVPGLYFWIRADRGVALGDAGADAGEAGVPVVGWSDIADSGTTHDLALNGASPPPRRESAPPGYGGNSAVRFGAGDSSRLSNLTATLAQPLTVFLVGHATTDAAYFFDSASASRVSMMTLTGKKLTLYTSTGIYAPPAGNLPADVPSVIVAVFDGASSRLFQSSDNSVDSLNPGNASLVGLTVGNFQLGNYGLGGVIAELALWAGALDTTTIRQLNHYAEVRYGITIAK